MGLKTHVLTVSRTFPVTHKRKGQQTWFVEQINDVLIPIALEPIFGRKLHTIRGNYLLWSKRIKEVQEGKAVLSLRYWSEKPYNSPQVEFCRLDKNNGVGIQKIEFYEDKDGVCTIKYPIIDNLAEPSIKTIAENDGLSCEDFKEWFRGYDLNEPMGIIHFTKFRY